MPQPTLTDRAVDEDIASDWASIREKYAADDTPDEGDGSSTAQPTAAAAGASESEEEQNAGGEGAAAGAERARDEAGRFVRAAKDETPAKPGQKPVQKPAATATPKAGSTPAAAAPAGAERGAQAASVPAGQAAPAADANGRDIERAPSTWKPAVREQWSKLSPEVRAEIHRREADFLNGQQQLLPAAKFGQAMSQAIQPYESLIAAQGGTPDAVVGNLLRTAAVLTMGTAQQKLQALAAIANDFQIDVRQLLPATPSAAPAGQAGDAPAGGAPAGAQPGPFYDPRVDQLLAHQRQQEQQRLAQDEQARTTAASRWANESDAQGQPLRPYLSDVMTEMAAFVPQIRAAHPELSHADVLQQAYDRACWANPDVRALLQQKQQTDLEAQRRAESQQRVRDARRAASVNVPRRASTPAPAKPGSLDETIRDTARTLGLIG